MTAPVLEVSGLVIEHRSQGRVVRAVRGVDLVIGHGESLAIVGESGAGKSTVGRAVLGELTPTAGTVLVDGQPVRPVSAPRLRRSAPSGVQAVFQNVTSSLNPSRRVEVSLEEALLATTGRAERRAIVADLLDRVGLPRDAGGRYPAEFSGGQRQRLAIARALIAKPRLIVCDEALSALDHAVQERIIELLQSVRAEFGVSLLLITHDLGTIDALTDRTCVMQAGRVVEAGPTSRLLQNPETAYTRLLVASTLVADPQLQRERRALAHAARAVFAAGTTVPTEN